MISFVNLILVLWPNIYDLSWRIYCVELAKNLDSANYSQSPDNFVWRYFYDLKGIVCYFVKAFYFLVKYLYMYDYMGVLN